LKLFVSRCGILQAKLVLDFVQVVAMTRQHQIKPSTEKTIRPRDVVYMRCPRLLTAAIVSYLQFIVDQNVVLWHRTVEEVIRNL
jgi:hypothetical protein